MMSKLACLLFLLLATASISSSLETIGTKNKRELKGSMSGKGSRSGSGKGGMGSGKGGSGSDSGSVDGKPVYYYKGKGKGHHKKKGHHIYLDVVNLAFDQPFSEFFVMVHDDTVEPIFTLGFEPSEPLAILAEDGNATDLVLAYVGTDGVLSADIFSEGAPFLLGQEVVIPVWVNEDYPYVTVAAMAINTNDAFVAINGMALVPGDRVTSVGYDAGSEENNEDCGSIPGPACLAVEGNVASGNGEGFVHVSRGVHGIEDLAPEEYDWRNPMMLVNVESEE